MVNGKRVKEARKSANLTQEQLGKLIGVGKSAVCCYEKETRCPSLEVLVGIMQVLGVSADYLLSADKIVKTGSDNSVKYDLLTNEEIKFVEDLRKNKIVYEILFDDPKRGSELVIKKIG